VCVYVRVCMSEVVAVEVFPCTWQFVHGVHGCRRTGHVQTEHRGCMRLCLWVGVVCGVSVRKEGQGRACGKVGLAG